MNTLFRSGSNVGADQTAAPDGPQSSVPMGFLALLVGASGIVWVFHTCCPDAASSETTLPRKVQHSYAGMPPEPSSSDDTGTYKRPWCNTVAPVIMASR